MLDLAGVCYEVKAHVFTAYIQKIETNALYKPVVQPGEPVVVGIMRFSYKRASTVS